jgi:hypothetical protein
VRWRKRKTEHEKEGTNRRTKHRGAYLDDSRSSTSPASARLSEFL